MKMEEADGFSMEGIWLNFKSGPVLSLKDTKNVQLEKLSTATQASLLVRANGEKTANIRIQRSDAAKAVKDLELGPEVKQGAVNIQ